LVTATVLAGATLAAVFPAGTGLAAAFFAGAACFTGATFFAATDFFAGATCLVASFLAAAFFTGPGACAARCFAFAVAVDRAEDSDDFAAVFTGTGFFASAFFATGFFAGGATVFFAACATEPPFLRKPAAGAAVFSFADRSLPEVALAMGVVLAIRLG
jgi:hypothetical protein